MLKQHYSKKKRMLLFTVLLVFVISVVSSQMCLGYEVKESLKGSRITIYGALGYTPYMSKLCLPRFEKQTGIKVDFVPLGWNPLHDKIAISLASQSTEVDVVMTWAAWTAEFGAPGYLEPIGDRITEEMRQDFVRGALEAVSYNGVVYGLPRMLSTLNMYCNTKMFREVGLDPNNIPTKWSELLHAFQKLTVEKNDKIRYGFAAQLGLNEPRFYTFLLFLQMAGGVMYDEEGYPIFDQAPGVLGLQYLVDLYKRYGVMDPVSITDIKRGGDMGTHFVQERAAIVFTWPFLYATAKDSLGVDNFKMDVIPGITQRTASVEGSEGWAISKFSKNKDAAFEWLKFIASKEEQKEMTIMDGWLPCLKSVLADPEVREKNPMAMVLEKFDELSVSPARRYGTPYYSEVAEIISREVERVFLTDRSVVDALHDAAQSVRDVIERYRE